MNDAFLLQLVCVSANSAPDNATWITAIMSVTHTHTHSLTSPKILHTADWLACEAECVNEQGLLLKPCHHLRGSCW